MRYNNTMIFNDFKSFINKVPVKFCKFISNFKFDKAISFTDFLSKNEQDLEILFDIIIKQVPCISMLIVNLHELEITNLNLFKKLFEYIIYGSTLTNFAISSFTVKFVLNYSNYYNLVKKSTKTNENFKEHSKTTCFTFDPEEKLHKTKESLVNIIENMSMALIENKIKKNTLKFFNFEIIEYKNERELLLEKINPKENQQNKKIELSLNRTSYMINGTKNPNSKDIFQALEGF
jgi:hypothetical protein